MRLFVLGTCALLLVGCTRDNSNNLICSTPETLEVSLKARDFATPTPVLKAGAYIHYSDTCVQRWAYRLAHASDPAAVVAAAAVAGCDDAVNAGVEARVEAEAAEDRNPARDWQSRTAELDRYERERLGRLALFAVVQARAGNCPIPK